MARKRFVARNRPMALASLTVIGAPAAPLDPMLEARGFYQRRDDYDGHDKARFFTTEDIDASGAVWTTDRPAQYGGGAAIVIWSR